MATIYDIAGRTGLSTATVSRALRGRDEVTPEVRERVERAAAELGYRPNRLATALSRGRTGMIGLVLPEAEGNPFYVDLTAAVSRSCREHGYEPIILMQSRDTEGSLAEAALCLEEQQIDGLLLFAIPVHLEHYMSQRRSDSPPVTAIGTCLDFLGPAVRADEHRAGGMVVEHLLSLGHERIAYMGGATDTRPGSREAGVAEALRRAGLPPRFDLTDTTAEGPRQCAQELMRGPEPPTAIIARNDHGAFGVLRGLAEMGVAVPDQVSVVGFDNLELARYFSPSLTTVDLRIRQIAQKAVEYLLDSVSAGEDQECTGPVTVQPELVIRESTGPAKRG